MMFDIRFDSSLSQSIQFWYFDNTIYHATQRNEQNTSVNLDSIKDPNTDVEIRNDSDMRLATFHDFGLKFDGVATFDEKTTVIDEHTIRHEYDIFDHKLSAYVVCDGTQFWAML